MADNQKFGEAYFLWSEFDALPRRLRNLVAHAPYSYSVTGLLKKLRKTNDVDYCARSFVEQVFSDRDRFLARDWSKDHPMIGARPEGWRG